MGTNSLSSHTPIPLPASPLKGEEDNDFPPLRDYVAIIELVPDKTEETVGDVGRLAGKRPVKG